jgi:hypothetical protein
MRNKSNDVGHKSTVRPCYVSKLSLKSTLIHTNTPTLLLLSVSCCEITRLIFRIIKISDLHICIYIHSERTEEQVKYKEPYSSCKYDLHFN